jgi:hypothetical protein
VKPITVTQLTQAEWLLLDLLVCHTLQGRFSSIFEFCRASVGIRKLFFSCQSLITAPSAAWIEPTLSRQMRSITNPDFFQMNAILKPTIFKTSEIEIHENNTLNNSVLNSQ